MKKVVLAMLVPIVPLCLGACTPPAAQPPKVTELMSKPLADIPGKEVVVLQVEFGPGGVDPVHKHNAHGFVYCVEGSVVMQVQGGEAVTLTPGQTFYEGPQDIHTVGRNASTAKPATIIAFLIKDKGAPALIPVP